GNTPTHTPTVKKTGGDQCTTGTECLSGFCPPEDGVCCDQPCDGASERCDLIAGTCLPIDLPGGSPCQVDQQCTSRSCPDGTCAAAPPTPTRTPNTRVPTFTRTATPVREPTLILARGSGCSTTSDSGNSWSGVAMLLVFPAWWFTSRRAFVTVRRKRARRD